MSVFSVYLDNGRIYGISPSDMSGNTGWIVTNDSALTKHTGTTVAELMCNLSINGSAIYVFRDGFAYRRTDEEIASDMEQERQEKPVKTNSELQAEISILNAKLLEYATRS